MVLLFRFVARVVKSIISHRIDDVREKSIVYTRIFLNDLDLNWHVNNGRVYSIADLGRIDWLIRARFMKLLKSRSIPVVGDSTAKFIKQLHLFEKVRIETQLLGWSDKWLFIESRIYSKEGQVAAITLTRLLFWNRQYGRVPIHQIFNGSHFGMIQSPPLPSWVQMWDRSLTELSNQHKRMHEEDGFTPSTPAVPL